MELQMRTILFFILMVSSAAEDVKRNLTGIVGGSVTFSVQVSELNYLMFKGNVIATVEDGNLKIRKDSDKDRLSWSNKTGVFTLRRLQQSDSGDYSVDTGKDIVSTTKYKLTVYEPVAAPTVKTVDVSEESCSLLCLINKSEETTLQWVRDKEVFNQSRSTLSLTLIISRKDFNSSFSCVASNPVEEKNNSVSIEALCKEPHPADTKTPSFRPYVIVISIVLVVAVVVALVVLFFRQYSFLKHKKRTRETEGSENQDVEVLYTDVQLNEATHGQGRNVPDSSGIDGQSNLRTVYDKVQAHRMSNAEREEHVYHQTVYPHA